ncbi:hypothetical protein MMC09_002171 [Bachmanniomyces sp. S44760]|nr:hypothetical protein [Bachmanniomyces sp. S44760]
MKPTLSLLAGRTPLIKFIGKRFPPASIDHTPVPHPASPSPSLPDSFANYRKKAQQHGPLNPGARSSAAPPPPAASASASSPSNSSSSSSSSDPPSAPQQPYGAVGGHSGHSLGSIKPKEGQYFDVSELPPRYRRTSWTEREIEAVGSGGASLW